MPRLCRDTCSVLHKLTRVGLVFSSLAEGGFNLNPAVRLEAYRVSDGTYGISIGFTQNDIMDNYVVGVIVHDVHIVHNVHGIGGLRDTQLPFLGSNTR